MLKRWQIVANSQAESRRPTKDNKGQRIHTRMFCYDKNILDLENGPDNYRKKNTYGFVWSVVMS